MNWKLLVLTAINAFSWLLADSANPSSLARKTNFQVSFILCNGYNDKPSELNDIKSLVSLFQSDRNQKIEKITFFRTDIKEFAIYKENEINFNDNIFIQDSRLDFCESNNMQEWADCGVHSFPFDKKYKDIMIYTSNPETKAFLRIGATNYKVYSNITIFNAALTELKKSLNNYDQILVLHYNCKLKSSLNCDTIKRILNTNPLMLQTNLLNNPSTIIRTIKVYNKNCFEIKWTYLNGIDNYIIELNGIPFEVLIDSANTYRTNYCTVTNNVVTCYLEEDILGKKCIDFDNISTYPSDCDECLYECIYHRTWSIVVKGLYSCQDSRIYFPPSTSSNFKYWLQCSGSNTR